MRHLLVGLGNLNATHLSGKKGMEEHEAAKYRMPGSADEEGRVWNPHSPEIAVVVLYVEGI